MSLGIPNGNRKAGASELRELAQRRGEICRWFFDGSEVLHQKARAEEDPRVVLQERPEPRDFLLEVLLRSRKEEPELLW